MPEKRILLVEDNANDEKLTLRALARNRIANPVVVARDGEEALDYLVGERAETFSLVLLDLRLPKVSGLQVLERLRADRRTQSVPVVLLTSSAQQTDRARGYALGANSYIQKPVDFQQFVAAVAQIGLYWLGRNEPPPQASG
jgi:two-component system response regulator